VILRQRVRETYRRNIEFVIQIMGGIWRYSAEGMSWRYLDDALFEFVRLIDDALSS